ncbi:putative wall-associated receptor kinase-like 16 isoform X2 [Citrus clementina]|uniref:putative wall-associated receptor kinase-like 16 isoform X2 n=1 Tax=Citrus clementina TaxID=85681 RepID=UPI000CED2923|nr:putative wall-associated receptor kinase-like 16 isoform X2 [Citrus x clementina]
MINKVAKKMWMLRLMLLLSSLAAASSSNVKPGSGCQEKCGLVTVPYPFGIDDPMCALNRNFSLNCSRRDSPPKLMIGDLEVFNLSIENGSMIASFFTARRCYDGLGNRTSDYNNPYVKLGYRPLRFSDTRNKLTAIGCDTLAYMGDPNGSFWTGCVSICTKESAKLDKSSCSGIGCCQIPLPKSLKSLNLTLRSIYDHEYTGKFMPCDYAILADETFNIAEFQASEDKSSSNVTIEWVVKEKKCPDDPNSKVYGCGDNTACYYSENGQGYRCRCKPGFQGNPYLGCVVIGPVIFSVIVGILIFIACMERRKQKNFLKNGGEILKHQSVRIFSAAELVKATKNYDESHFLGEGGFGSVYKGVLPDNTQIAVKKPKESDKIRINQEFQKEMGIVSRINHKNVVKILGLCLQTKVPLLVYEFVSNGTLSHHIHDKSSPVLRTWKMCLGIAAEIASALDYFHSLASPPIIHGDVKSSNILLDDKYIAKVADFGASVLISPDQAAMATKIQGTFGYLDPEYLMTGNLTEKSDVYSFGVVLVELLTGVKPGSHMTPASNEKINIVQYFLSSIENNSLRQILSFRVADESELEEVEIVAELASECLRSSGSKRPTMKQVSEELDRLKRLHENLWAQENSEETEHLLGESSTHATAVIAQPNTQTFESFDIENYGYSM